MWPVVCASVLSAVLLLAIPACSTNDDLHTPVIAAITPEHAAPETFVALSGSYFCAQPEPEDGEDSDPLACENIGIVSFEEMPGTASDYTDSRIIALVPRLAPGTVEVRLAVAGRMSNHLEFRIDAPAP